MTYFINEIVSKIRRWTKSTFVSKLAPSKIKFWTLLDLLTMMCKACYCLRLYVMFHCAVLKCDSTSMALKVRLWPMTRGALLVLPPQLLLVRFSLPKHKTGALEAT